MIRAIIFDIDNTLMDFMRMKRAAVAAAVDGMIDAGIRMPKDELEKKIFDRYWEVGIEDQSIFDKVLGDEFGRVDYKILAAGILAYRRAKDGTMTLYPHVKMTLTALLKSGIKMGVITDAPRLNAWMRLVGLGLHHYFDHVVTSEDVGERKPAPGPFRRAMELLESGPGETLMVGDWAERDIKGAKALGMKTAWAKYGDTFDTKESGADYELDDVLELVDIVSRENDLPLEYKKSS